MVLFRAHIALIMVLAFGVASVLDAKVGAARKLFLIVGGMAAVGVLLGTIESSFGVDLTDTSSVSSFWQSREMIETRDTSSTSLGGAGFLVRLVSLLFRPFFIDADGAFGLVASVENLGSFLLLGYLLRHFREVRYLAKRVLFLNFTLIFTFGLIIVLALLTYNVGLGLRERTMMFPPLFCLFAAVRGYMLRQVRAGVGTQQPIRTMGPAAVGLSTVRH